MANGAHAHVADNVTTNYVVLSVSVCVHNQVAGNVALGVDLVVQNAAHQVTSDNATLQMQGDVAVQSATHAHAADNITLTQVLIPVDLVVANAAHAHTSANVTAQLLAGTRRTCRV